MSHVKCIYCSKTKFPSQGVSYFLCSNLNVSLEFKIGSKYAILTLQCTFSLSGTSLSLCSRFLSNATFTLHLINSHTQR
jgi:hypothetical protein